MRKIDGKFHIDGDKIIKTSNGDVIPEDEPLFLFRGRDDLATFVLEYYRTICEESGCTDYQMEGINTAIERFHKFCKEHPERMKQPGITRGL